MVNSHRRQDKKPVDNKSELGNLQSEGHGISGFETMLSIGLGQEQQFTLILQTLQQLSWKSTPYTCNECMPLHQLNTRKNLKSLYATT